MSKISLRARTLSVGNKVSIVFALAAMGTLAPAASDGGWSTAAPTPDSVAVAAVLALSVFLVLRLKARFHAQPAPVRIRRRRRFFVTR